MKLLFGKTNASTELKSLLGYMDADIKFEKIKPDVVTSTNELIDLIGLEVYNKVLGIYNAGSTEENDQYFIYLVRYPIAIRAYALLAPSNDIAHTNNGRKMRQDTNEKQAFEWMLDRDNTAQEKRYYRALDDLIKYLDLNSDEWKISKAFKASHKLFIRTTDQFNEFFRIDSRLVMLKLYPGIRRCEQDRILPILGSNLFSELKTVLNESGELTEEQDQILYLVQEACVYYSLSWAMMRLSVHLFPEGVLQSYTSDRMSTQGKLPAVKSETEAARQVFDADARTVLEKLEKLVTRLNTTEQGQFTNNGPDFLSGHKYIST